MDHNLQAAIQWASEQMAAGFEYEYYLDHNEAQQAAQHMTALTNKPWKVEPMTAQHPNDPPHMIRYWIKLA